MDASAFHPAVAEFEAGMGVFIGEGFCITFKELGVFDPAAITFH